LPTRNPAPLQVTQTMNECWSADFMSDALWDGRRFRNLQCRPTTSIVKHWRIVVDFSLTAERVAARLEAMPLSAASPQAQNG